jgi:Tol biopolymer transport system component
VASGGGTLSPTQVETDVSGEAKCTFTAGTQPGITTVAASIQRAELTFSDTQDLMVDPLAVSPALLSTDFGDPLMGSWSHDGSFVVFQTETYNDYGLYKVDVGGGDPVLLGNYRGGACKPDGSERIAVLGPPTGGWPEDDSLYVVDYDGRVVGAGIRPSTFYGEMRAVCWCQNGDSLLIAANTNMLYCVTDTSGITSRQFTGPVWAHTLSPVSNTPLVVIEGTGEYSGGIYSFDLDSGQSQQLVVGGGWYEYGPDLKGASVDSEGTTVVYSALKAIQDGYAEQHDLFTLPFEGGVSQGLISGPKEEMYPVWSPDGTKVLFSSDRTGNGYNLYIYTVPGSARTKG